MFVGKKVTIKQTVLDTKFYERLTVLGISLKGKDFVDILCECGVIKPANIYSIYRGETTSCGGCRKVGNLEEDQYFINNKFGNYTVESIIDSHNVVVKFDTGNYKNVTAAQARSGSIMNPLHRTVHGVGYMGIGEYKSRIENNTTKTPQYRAWENMMSRCYYPRASRYMAYGGSGVTVCEEWHNFQSFAKWFDVNFKEGCDLDKDIIGNGKIYSPEYCRYIPSKLNRLLNTSPTRTGSRKNDLPEGVTVDSRGVFIANFGTYYREEFNNCNNAKEAYLNFKTRFVRNLVEEIFEKGQIKEDVYLILMQIRGINDKQI